MIKLAIEGYHSFKLPKFKYWSADTMFNSVFRLAHNTGENYNTSLSNWCKRSKNQNTDAWKSTFCFDINRKVKWFYYCKTIHRYNIKSPVVSIFDSYFEQEILGCQQLRLINLNIDSSNYFTMWDISRNLNIGKLNSTY